MTALSLIPPPPPQPITDLISISTQLLPSAQSRRVYTSRLTEFLRWSADRHPPSPFNRLTVERYLGELISTGKGSSSRNQSIAAIKKLALTASAHHIISPQTALDISQIKSCPQKGIRSGNWLGKDDCLKLLEWSPNTPCIGKVAVTERRDRAIIALLLGCGIRREECAQLNWDRLQMRDGRWALVDIVGKGKRVRTVPVPGWAHDLLTEHRAGRSIDQDQGKIIALSANAIWEVVSKRAHKLGLKCAPHDLRRTFAKLSRKGGARIEQIQLALGHASVQTTERYLGTCLDMGEAACDKMGL